LSEAETNWVKEQEYSRKPGHEVQKHLPDMWFVTPTAGHWKAKYGSDANDWIAHHATNIANVKAGGDIDIALIGDSITQGWGGGFDGVPFNAAWQKHFGTMKTGLYSDQRPHLGPEGYEEFAARLKPVAGGERSHP
jgi:hypothetical protein